MMLLLSTKLSAGLEIAETTPTISHSNPLFLNILNLSLPTCRYVVRRTLARSHTHRSRDFSHANLSSTVQYHDPPNQGHREFGNRGAFRVGRTAGRRVCMHVCGWMQLLNEAHHLHPGRLMPLR